MCWSKGDSGSPFNGKIMDYEKKYNEALEKARKLYNDAKANEYISDMEDYEYIFPEVAESEDERIRTTLKEAFEAYDIESSWNGIPIRSIFTWLEKQKEQKNTSASTMAPSCLEVKQKEQNGEDGFLEDELSAFLQNYDKEYDDDAAVSDVARHFYEIGKKQNEQKSVPFSCGHENGKSTEWAELQSEFKNINEAFEDGKKEVIDHLDKYGLTKQKQERY